MAAIPEAFLDLFQKRAFAHFATVMADGTPQITPVGSIMMANMCW